MNSHSTSAQSQGAAGQSPDGIEELMALCERLAREAGDHVRAAGSGVAVAGTKTSVNDVVTAVDREVEQLLRTRIAQARPGDAFLGEEDGAVAGTTGLTWVVDPIDGTVNFLYGIPSYSVSVAVVSGAPDPRTWTVLAGCVHAVTAGTTWSAGRGLGAWRDGERLRIKDAVPLGQALVSTGFGYTEERRREQAGIVAQILPQVRDIRRIGSVAIDLCLVADGRLDAHYERGLNAWDVAAGTLVVTEAGGTVEGLSGLPASKAMTVAGAAPLVAELTAALEAAGAPATM
ncbi:inositol monophosphatase family protein [Georgenia sp. SYP-B2076]|uniref:inositol monophosphatase family protein n=1 Tax=Georgenia sp. SYP-B2076 TaxID=2495881 RepID=UPI001F0CA845|nr:inositol monophosphatase family protein [Georgenia sp. SYP-B2076]